VIIFGVQEPILIINVKTVVLTSEGSKNCWNLSFAITVINYMLNVIFQENSWKWSLPGPLDPSPTHQRLYLMSYGRFPQGHVTPVLPLAPLQAWQTPGLNPRTPEPPPPGEETPLASAKVVPALTPQVNPQYTSVGQRRKISYLWGTFVVVSEQSPTSVWRCVFRVANGQKSRI